MVKCFPSRPKAVERRGVYSFGGATGAVDLGAQNLTTTGSVALGQCVTLFNKRCVAKIAYLKKGIEIAVSNLVLLDSGNNSWQGHQNYAQSNNSQNEVNNYHSEKLNIDNSLFNNSIPQIDVKWEKIASIEYVGEEQVYDIEVENTHNFIAHGIVAHNTYISGYGLADLMKFSVKDFEYKKEYVIKHFA